MSHVAVLMGGYSAERDISLVSGRAVSDVLRQLGHEVSQVDVDRHVATHLAEIAPDVAFNALHGRWGEDGCIQGMLETMGVPYTHSGVRASAVAMHKVLAKTVFRDAGLTVAEGRVVQSARLTEADPLPRPYVLKPIAEGSSVGVAIVTDDSDYGRPIDITRPGPWRDYPELLAEPYIPGRELAVSVMDGEALAVTELKPRQGFYDYTAKYTEGMTEHVLPADLPPAVTEAAKGAASAAHRALGCRGVTRADIRYDEDKPVKDGLYLLEVNTQPGMTPLSLVPEQAASRGIEFPALVEWMLEDASCDR